MTDKRQAGGFGLEVLAGGLAAITAAMIGSGLGVTGTVAGAGIASVVSTLAAAVYLRSARSVAVRAGTRTVAAERPERNRRTPGWPVLVAGGVLAFALGMLVITGVEWVRGAPLSGGQGTTIGAIVAPRPHRAPAPPVEESVPVNGTPESATTTTPAAPTTTTTPPPATTTTTTSSPSATTTPSPGHSEPDQPPATGPSR